MLVAALTPGDYDQWLPLWRANTENQIGPEITAQTWERLCDPLSPVGGLCARADHGSPVAGICHFILHPTTGNLNPVCYMQDLYVDPVFRRRGIARLLVTYLAAQGTAEKWARIYWLAEERNAAAQALYKSLGLKLDFTLHVLPLKT